MDLAVGRVAKSHGVRGELVVDIRTDSPEERFAPGTRLRGHLGRGAAASTREVVVAAARSHSGRLLVRLEGVDSRTEADALRGMVLTVDSSQVADPEDPEEFHDHQLVGLAARGVDGADLGRVTDVLHTPAGELLSVTTAAGHEVLVPFVTAIVPEVDLAGGSVTVDPPEGLFDAPGPGGEAQG